MNQDELKDFYAHALAIIDESLSNVINDVSQSASASVLTFATPVLILVVMMYGFKIARGGAHYADAAWKIVFWVAVYILGTSTAIYQENIAQFFFSWPDWLANSLVTNGQEANKLTGFIDQVFAGYMTVSLRFQELGAASTTSIADSVVDYVFAFLLAGTGVLVCTYAMGLLVIAHVFISIELAVGMVFIFFLVSEYTRSFFGSWITQLVTHGLVIVFTSLALIVIVYMSNTVFGKVLGGDLSEAGIGLVMILISMGGISFLVLTQVKDEAARIAGGMAGSLMGMGTASYRASKNAVSAGHDVASGNTLAAWRGKARFRQVTSDWRKNNPGVSARALNKLRGR